MSSSTTSTSSSSSEDDIDFVVYTASEMLKEGLLFARIPKRKFRKWKKKTRVDTFVSRYGSKPDVLCEILEDLRPELYKQFPLDVFRDHIYQKIKTDKYLHTLKVKGKGKRKPK